MSTAPYPHVEISVRDDSIATVAETEVLPLSKPLFFMRAQKGPVGVPVWCPAYSNAERIFGAETFDVNSIYFSEQAYFLLKTFPSNGAFIVRVAGSSARPAEISIEIGISKATVGVPQWKRDANGAFVYNLDGSKIAIDENGDDCVVDETKTVTLYSRALETTAITGRQYFARQPNFKYSEVASDSRRKANTTYFAGQGRVKVEKCGDNEAYVEGTFYFLFNEDFTKVTPKFGLTKAEYDAAAGAGSKFAKLAGWENGYREVAEQELPEIVAGNVSGDKFEHISTAEFSVTLESGSTYVGTAGSYALTTDATFKRDKTYYTKAGEVYSVAVVNAGAAVAADTYYEYSAAFASYKFTRALIDYTFVALTKAVGDPIEAGTYYLVKVVPSGEMTPQGTIPGRKLAWRAHVVSYYGADGQYHRRRAIGDKTTSETDKFTWYPMFDVIAENPGLWGKKFGLKVYFDENSNSLSAVQTNSANTYTIAPVQIIGDDTTPTPIVDGYGQSVATGVIRPKTVDPSTGVSLVLINRLEGAYSGNYKLPITITMVPENWNIVGKLLMKYEIEGGSTSTGTRAEILKKYSTFRTIEDGSGNEVAETFVDAMKGSYATEADLGIGDDKIEIGYTANPLSLVCPERIPYFATYIVDSQDADIVADGLASEIVVPSVDAAFYLAAGEDGPIADADVESYIQKAIMGAKAGTNENLIDYARFPYNVIYDTGVSFTTKKAYLDMLMVRDSLVVNLTTQQIWKNADGSTPSVAGEFPNSRYDDESLGSSLRAYAWLMKEDIVNGTGACRAKIFLHAGYTSDHDGPVASTLWIALKDSEYLNRPYITQEPKGLPNADIGCFTDLSWTASTEDTKSRCWNAGLNYAQFYNMKSRHYASVRTVYRYETSILVDSGVVNALTFMKDETRRSWATFAGMTLPAAEMNKLITEDLSDRFGYLLNNKYKFTVSVYQTDDDVILGYVRHVDVELIAPATNRVWLATFICKREGYQAS